MARTDPRKDFQERFWSKVRKTSTCWIWTGATVKSGYGHLRMGSRADGTRRLEKAHRLSWEIHHGPIPAGKSVLHSCDRPACVRPTHLFLGTQPENIQDMMAKGRESRGEAHPTAKLTVVQVKAIRASGATRSVLARKYSVSEGTIQHVQERRTWRAV